MQFSDLHLNPSISNYFLKKLQKSIAEQSPEMLIFTGDMLCWSEFKDKERLFKFMKSLNAPYGCYAILGNHDYASTVSINNKGEYDIQKQNGSPILQGFQRLFSKIRLARRTTERAKAIGLNQELVSFLQTTPFTLLHNKHTLIRVKNSALNLVGLGEYTMGRCDPGTAFQGYDKKYPGIILAHNPDSFPLLKHCPGDVVLSGHTHGGQINLPWLWKKFTLLENMEFKQGLFHIAEKWLYVSRGVGSIMPFRLFTVPELVTIILEPEK